MPTEAGADLNTQIAAHLLHGVVMRPRSDRGDSAYLDTSPAALSARVSISRAFGRLQQRSGATSLTSVSPKSKRLQQPSE